MRRQDGNSSQNDVWYRSLASFIYTTCVEVIYVRACCPCLGAILNCFCCSCCVIRRILKQSVRRETKFGQLGIVYFYIIICATVVLNLGLVVKKQASDSNAYRVLQFYVIGCMWASNIGLSYIYGCARKLRLVSNHHALRLTFYLRTGLYLFGILSIGYSVALSMDFLNCHEGCCLNKYIKTMETAVQITKAIFIVAQMLFLGSFYQIQFPTNIPYIQVVLAHLIGTNLTLWFWTLCLEVRNPLKEVCRSYPISLGDNIDKIFYPILVEYLLLAASMYYEIWNNLKGTEPTTTRYDTLDYQSSAQEPHGEVLPPGETAPRPGSGNTQGPNFGRTLVFALCFLAVFLVFIFASDHVGKIDEFYYELFTWMTCTVYVTQILACFIVGICIQTQTDPPDSTLKSSDYDEKLLYLGLGGIVLWEGFHFYGMMTLPSEHVARYEVVVDILGVFEYFSQTIILVLVKRYQSSNDENAKWICHCAIFLFVTNFAHWCQDTYFIVAASDLEKPGEHHLHFKEDWEVFGHILNPLIVFFRFHSATYCYQVWLIFSGRNELVNVEERDLQSI